MVRRFRIQGRRFRFLFRESGFSLESQGLVERVRVKGFDADSQRHNDIARVPPPRPPQTEAESFRPCHGDRRCITVTVILGRGRPGDRGGT